MLGLIKAINEYKNTLKFENASYRQGFHECYKFVREHLLDSNTIKEFINLRESFESLKKERDELEVRFKKKVDLQRHQIALDKKEKQELKEKLNEVRGKYIKLRKQYKVKE